MHVYLFVVNAQAMLRGDGNEALSGAHKGNMEAHKLEHEEENTFSLLLANDPDPPSEGGQEEDVPVIEASEEVNREGTANRYY